MQNIANLSMIFVNCSKADPNIRKNAESDLKKLSEAPQYPILLAQYLLSEKTPDLALRAAIELKKWCDDYKKLEGYEALCRKDAVEELKSSIFSLLINTDNKVGIQIAETIYLLSTKEFPERWPALAKNLASFLSLNNNLEKQYLVMKTLLKIFKKYEYSERSDPLYEEIILVADECHDIFLNFTNILLQNLNEKNLGLLKLSLKIFYCLNFQDLHPNYENNLNTWMGLIAQVLRLDSKIFRDDILILRCKGEAMRCILLYVTKYRDEFESLIQNFSQEIWNICLNTSDDNKYDKIVLNALKYFKTLILWPSLNAYFKQNISILINSLIIPNLKVSKNDQYLFKEESENFVDIFFNNNSEITSRKSVTIELLKNLSRYYKEDLNQIFQNSMLQYIESLKTGGKNLETETTLINLYCDGVSVAFRPKDGVTEVSIQPEFFQYIFDNLFSNYLVQIYNDIISQSLNFVEDKYNVLNLAFICRFLFYFRNFLDKKSLLELAKVISYFSKTKSESLISVVYYTVESIIDIKEGNFKSLALLPNYFHKDNLMPQIAEILQNFYNAGKTSPMLNNYLLRVFLMIIKSLKGECANFLPAFIDFYKETLQKMTKGYTYQSALYIFEALSLLIQSSCQGNKNSENMIESSIIPILNDFFNKNLSDLFSFVIQIFSIVIQTFSIDNIKETYLIVFNSILDPKNWLLDNSSIFPAYCIYLDNFYKKFPQKIFETQDSLKNIMLTLLSNNLESLYFNLSYSLINNISFNDLKNSNWLSFIFSNLFNYYGKLQQHNQTPEMAVKQKNVPSRPIFIKDLFVFICHCFIKFDAVQFISMVELISPNALSSFLVSELIVLKNIQRKGLERRIVFYGICNLLFLGFFGNGISGDVWAQILSSLVENIINRKNIRVRGRVEFIGATVSGINSESGFQKLSTIKDIREDINPADDEEKYFALKFHEFITNPQVKNVLNIGNILSIQQQEAIMKILQG